MASLKDLRARIASVKSTRKITSAMKMVAASKLRRAQTAAESSRPYAERMERMVSTLAGALKGNAGAPPMLVGNGTDRVNLIVMVTADRGLCGGFNTSVVRNVRHLANELLAAGKTVAIMPVGRKGRDQIRRDFGAHLVDGFEQLGRKGIRFDEAEKVANRVIAMFDNNEFDVCWVVYNRFKSAITQEVTRHQMIPFESSVGETVSDSRAVYEFEPCETEILDDLLPRNFAVQMFRALMESQASEQGARIARWTMPPATRAI